MLGSDGLIFVRHHGGINHPTDQRLIAVLVAAYGRKLHLVVGDAEFRKRRACQHVGHRVWRRHRNQLALQILDLGYFFVDVDTVRDDEPMTSKQPGVSPFGVGRKNALRSAFEAVEFAGDQRLEGKLIVLELRYFDLEALLLRKVTRGHHQKNACIGLGIYQPVLPYLFLRLPRSDNPCQRRGNNDSGESNRAHSHVLSSLKVRLDGVSVVLMSTKF